jgi:RES domain-containing protein
LSTQPADTSSPSAQPVRLWRIAGDMPNSPADELNGEESVESGGRWSHPGTALVYLCTNPALACLETLAHLPPGPLPQDRFLVEVQVPADLWAARRVFAAVECPGWDAVPHGPNSQDWGMRWIQAQDSALACVPSVIAPELRNVLVNPAHPAVLRIFARKCRRWTYDPRLRPG